MANAQIDYISEDVQTEKMGFLKRVAGIILFPGKVMDNLKARPRVLFPLILVAVSMTLLYLARFPLYKDFLRESQMASSAFTESLTGVKMTADMIEQSMPMASIMGLVTTPLGTLFMWLLTTVVYFAIFKIAGAQGRFKHYCSVTGYAYVITALGYVVTLIASFFTGSLHLNVPLTSLASLFDTGLKGQFYYGVMKGLDLFPIWYACITAIGLYKISGFKKKTSYGIVAAVFIAGLLITGAGEVMAGSLL